MGGREIYKGGGKMGEIMGERRGEGDLGGAKRRRRFRGREEGTEDFGGEKGDT